MRIIKLPKSSSWIQILYAQKRNDLIFGDSPTSHMFGHFCPFHIDLVVINGKSCFLLNFIENSIIWMNEKSNNTTNSFRKTS